MMGVQVIEGECLEKMAALPSGSVDLILTDLPYGTTKNAWDSVIPFEPMWREYRRICRGAILLTASQPFTSTLVCSALDIFKYAWVWEKGSATGHLNAKRMPMKLHEDVLVFAAGAHSYNPQGLVPFGKTVKRGNNGTNFDASGKENFQEFTNYPRSILRFPAEEKALHPTQKPVALFEYLIKTYTNEGDTVLDCCAGSGTTGIAARNCGRNAILIEREPKYLEVIRNRLADGPLFAEAM